MMRPEFTDALAALPRELRAPEQTDELAQLLATLTSRPAPTGRIARLWNLGSLQARIAFGYGLTRLRELRLNDAERRALRDTTHLRTALKLFESMGYLRGAVMKAGQLLASYPSLLPEQFVEALEAFHFDAPPMHFSLLREQVRAELGGDPEELFAQFDTEAFAAASLGQVHRARTKSGDDVVVKVQYPNIARSIEADCKNARALLQPLRFLKDWRNTMDVLEDIRVTLTQETDYHAEADNARACGECLAELDDVVVPRVFPDLSSEHVLTMERVAGRHLRPFLATSPDQATRDRAAKQILRVNYRLWCAGRIHADPHPGNYLFLEDGRLGLLDFGCVRQMNDQEWAAMLAGVRAEQSGDEDDLREAIRLGGLLSDEEVADPERYDTLRRSIEWLWEPLTAPQPFDFSDGDYLQRGFDAYRALVTGRYTRAMPVFTWMNRMLLGVRGLFFSLGARLDYKRVNDEELARAGLIDATR